ncbi:ph domain-containing protein [Stylonychia lemnae]|uniref:Ph domain-containing protein n=1 Tax=Stylonychia lemnae TaxID=5949 RepID=A0A078B6D6_STYLE|nr:ph domain-containing protein [Stylonychia lemnae]|eukprot:CDW89924.1 ph domain-containing protein [Stylonychia lemnae]
MTQNKSPSGQNLSRKNIFDKGKKPLTASTMAQQYDVNKHQRINQNSSPIDKLINSKQGVLGQRSKSKNMFQSNSYSPKKKGKIVNNQNQEYTCDGSTIDLMQQLNSSNTPNLKGNKQLQIFNRPPAYNQTSINLDSTLKMNSITPRCNNPNGKESSFYSPVQVLEIDPLIDLENQENQDDGREEYKAMTLAKIASTNVLLQEKTASLILSQKSFIEKSKGKDFKDIQILEEERCTRELPCVKIELINSSIQNEFILVNSDKTFVKSSTNEQDSCDILSQPSLDNPSIQFNSLQPTIMMVVDPKIINISTISKISEIQDENDTQQNGDSQSTIIQKQSEIQPKKSIVRNFKYNIQRFQQPGNQQNDEESKDDTQSNRASNSSRRSSDVLPVTFKSRPQTSCSEEGNWSGGSNSEEMKYSVKDCETSELDSNKSKKSVEEQKEDDCEVIEKEEALIASLLTIKYQQEKYKEYYAIVRNKRFKYYSDKSMKKLGGIIDFDRVQVVIMIEDDEQSSDEEDNSNPQDLRKFRIEVIGCKRQFIFKVPTSSHLRRWTQALYSNWNSSKSFTLSNSHGLLSSNFWKSTSFVTKVQRAITMSEYDHVAMLLRYSNGKLVIFESTGTTGVAVLDWDVFVKNNWHNLYQKLAYRKLRHQRNIDNMGKLETFIRTVIGMKYKLNAAKILRKHFENDAENIKGDKSYFCSELVASAYKCLGLLPKEISASQYWPGSFANKSSLQLQGRALLEDEQQIEFHT